MHYCARNTGFFLRQLGFSQLVDFPPLPPLPLERAPAIMDQRSVYSLSVLPPDEEGDDTRQKVLSQLMQFILQFRLDSVFIYRSVFLNADGIWLTRSSDQIRENVLLKQYYCDVNVGHLISFDEELAHRLVTEPTEIIPLVSASF